MEERRIVRSGEQCSGGMRAHLAERGNLAREDADRLTAAGWMRVSSQWKSEQHGSAFAGDIAAHPAGPKSPAPRRQAIEFAQDFGAKKISRLKKRNVTMEERVADAIVSSDSGWPRVSSQRKNMPREEVFSGSNTGDITGLVTGLESPVMRHQAIEFA